MYRARDSWRQRPRFNPREERRRNSWIVGSFTRRHPAAFDPSVLKHLEIQVARAGISRPHAEEIGALHGGNVDEIDQLVSSRKCEAFDARGVTALLAQTR